MAKPRVIYFGMGRVEVEFVIDGRPFVAQAYWGDFQSFDTLPYWAGDLPQAVRRWAGLE